MKKFVKCATLDSLVIVKSSVQQSIDSSYVKSSISASSEMKNIENVGVLQDQQFTCECSEQISSLIDNEGHRFYEYMGAFCPLHQTVHYRWIEKEWEIHNPGVFQRAQTKFRIAPEKQFKITNYYFLTDKYWNCEKIDQTANFVEVNIYYQEIEGNDGIPRPKDTGYILTNAQGVYIPVISTIYEILLLHNEFKDLRPLLSKSNMSKSRIGYLEKAIENPNLTNLCNIIWRFANLVPGFTKDRRLGAKSSTFLILQEIIWNSYNPENEDLDLTDLFINYKFLEYDSLDADFKLFDDLAGVQNVLSGGSIRTIYHEFAQIGLEIEPRLGRITLLTEGRRKSRAWFEVASRSVNWGIKYNKNGQLDIDTFTRNENGFIQKLRTLLEVEVPSGLNSSSFGNSSDVETISSKPNLVIEFPLCWELEEIVNEKLRFSYVGDELELEHKLEKTLKIIHQSIKDNNSIELIFPTSIKETSTIRAFTSRLKFVSKHMKISFR